MMRDINHIELMHPRCLTKYMLFANRTIKIQIFMLVIFNYIDSYQTAKML